MTRYKKDRLSSEIVKETSRILLHEMKDPRLGFVTVTRAKLSDDYRHAKVFVSVMGSPRVKKLTMSGLRHARGYVQAALSRRIPMKVSPEIEFALDESIEEAFQVTRILDELARERLRKNGAKAAVPGGEEE